MIRRITIVMGTTLVGLAIGGAALGGGWAMTRVDEMPAVFEANTTYQITYSILQHGKSPVDVDGTSLTFTHPYLKMPLTFEGERAGRTGQYVAEVNLPETGLWAWKVTQGWFGDQELGTVETVALAPAPPPADVDLLRLALPVLTLIVVGVLITQVVAHRRRFEPVRVD